MNTAIPSVQRPWGKALAIAGVVLVPLAFAGLAVGAMSPIGEGADRIPAALVNEDSLVMITAADGSESPVFAGRLLVTELTADGSSSDAAPSALSGIDWVITNAAAAEEALAKGEVYAVLTVPSNFSTSILSLSTATPEQANISVRTDDAHSYLAGSVAQAVGDGMVRAFGDGITAQYITGLYANVGSVGAAFADAAAGASGIESGAVDLASGLAALSDGAAASRSGASSLAAGLSTYTAGVGDLSAGLADLDAGAAGLGAISSGVSSYTAGVTQLSGTLASINGALQASNADATTKATLQAVVNGLAQSSAGGKTLASQTKSGISGVRAGIGQSADGAAALASGSWSLTSGARSLAGGLGSLTSGASDAADGAGELASGAGELASGLQKGADSIPAVDTSAAIANAAIAADPVTFTVSRDNGITEVTRVFSTVLVPFGLWLGAFATFLLLAPLANRVLSSSARDSRLLASGLGRALAIAVVQAIALVALLHTGLGVGLSALPATLGFSLLTAFAFTAFHYLLTLAFGRAGLIVSLLLLAIQLTTTGGIYPIEALAAPFRMVSPLLPLSHAVGGMQSIIAGADPGRAVAASLVLLGFGVVSVALAAVALHRKRRAAALAVILAH